MTEYHVVYEDGTALIFYSFQEFVYWMQDCWMELGPIEESIMVSVYKNGVKQ